MSAAKPILLSKRRDHAMSQTFLRRYPLRGLVLALAMLPLAGCMVGPDYHRPSAPISVNFKEVDGWRQAQPAESAPKGPWWLAFNDPTLSGLLAQVQISNQNVAEYAAELQQAQALLRQADANLFPTIDGTATGTRSATGHTTTNNVSAELSASWELDLWGKLRRALQEQKATVQVQQADLANATLSAQSTLAQDYFTLRVLDVRIGLYQQTVTAYAGYLRVVQGLYDNQIDTLADLGEAQSQLESARASLLDLQWQRAQSEHAIALLIGKSPAQFSLPADPNWTYSLPSFPVGMPSTLLERRPDIAAAERQMAVENAAVGVATAAYFPDLTLSASGGFAGSSLSKLFSVPNRVWSIGPELTGTVFDFGATRAEVEQARAAYDASVATYRQTVLTAVGEVEDLLVELRTLEPEVAAQRRAQTASQTAAKVNFNQYQEGMIDFLDVATTQATFLSAQQSVWELVQTQLTASVQLYAALGGGWTMQDLKQP